MNGQSESLVCICVPTYNAGPTLARTLDAILGQTYRDILVLIVDNASSDNTVEIAKGCALRDSRLRVVPNAENLGAEGNFNRCLALAAGEYTAIYHSDDLYDPSIVEREVRFLVDHAEAGAVFCMADTIDEAGRPGRAYRLPSGLKAGAGGLYDFSSVFKAALRNGNFLFCPTALVRTRIYRDEIKTWDGARFGSSADLDVWFRILLKHPVGIINEPLLKYRVSSASYSYTASRAKTGPHDMLRVFDHYVNGCAKAILGPEDLAAYSSLLLNDNVNRAFNLAVLGKPDEARGLMSGVFRCGSLARALGSVYHFKTVSLAALAVLLIFLPFPERARRFISVLRFKTRG